MKDLSEIAAVPEQDGCIPNSMVRGTTLYLRGELRLELQSSFAMPIGAI